MPVSPILTPVEPFLQDAPAPTPEATPSCSASTLCDFIWRQTEHAWLAESSYWVLVKPLTILGIIVGALVVRFLVHRAIDRLIKHSIADPAGAGGRRAAPRPLRGRMPTSFVLPSDRRSQRAKAIGSVLRSFASATVFAVAVMMVLDELGLNLGPILASAGIVGLALGFGAQNLVKDFLAGLFILLEDQYGVGDLVDVGEASGTVEEVGLRITTIRDGNGVRWYIRNGEVVRVGNKSQGWAMVTVDLPVGFGAVSQATALIREAATELAADPEWADDILAAPEVLGVEQITADGAVLRTTIKTSPEGQWKVGRELRRRLTEALGRAGIAGHPGAGQLHVRPPAADPLATTDGGTSGPT